MKNKDLFSEKLIEWYHQNKRALPWRDTQNPYHIWLSEVILQQTRVKQGLPYYQKFIKNYPNVVDLAGASEEEVLRLWQGLGYYSRARNLHKAAKTVVNDYKGIFPNTFQEIIKLKGVGIYTAAAIASFAFDERVAVVDGNVYRVLARFFGEDTDIASYEGQKKFAQLAEIILPQKDVSIYNQAIMEFGALQCTPQKPNCMFCPVQENCYAFAEGKQKELPVKISKIKVRERFFNYLVFKKNGKLALRQRNNKDVWAGLYDFALIEEKELSNYEEIKNKYFPEMKDLKPLHQSKAIKHILSHQKIWSVFWQLEVKEIPKAIEEMYAELVFLDKSAIEKIPKPILIEKYLQKHFF